MASRGPARDWSDSAPLHRSPQGARVHGRAARTCIKAAAARNGKGGGGRRQGCKRVAQQHRHAFAGMGGGIGGVRACDHGSARGLPGPPAARAPALLTQRGVAARAPHARRAPPGVLCRQGRWAPGLASRVPGTPLGAPHISPHSVITHGSLGRLAGPVATASILRMMSMPSPMTRPNTCTCGCVSAHGRANA